MSSTSSTPSPRLLPPHRWGAARRVQLAVSASVRHLASPTTQFDESYNTGAATRAAAASSNSLSTSSLSSSTKFGCAATPPAPTPSANVHWPDKSSVGRGNSQSNVTTAQTAGDSNNGDKITFIFNSEDGLLNLADVSTTNIDDAMQSLYDATVIAQLLHEDTDDNTIPNAALTESCPWWGDTQDGSIVSTSRSVWDRRNEDYAQVQCLERLAELHADPLHDVAAQLLADEQERALQQEKVEQQQRELDNWNAFPQDTIPSSSNAVSPCEATDSTENQVQDDIVPNNEADENDDEMFGDFHSALAIQNSFEGVAAGKPTSGVPGNGPANEAQKASTDDASNTIPTDGFAIGKDNSQQIVHESESDDEAQVASTDDTNQNSVAAHNDDGKSLDLDQNSSDIMEATVTTAATTELFPPISRAYSDDDASSSSALGLVNQADDLLRRFQHSVAVSRSSSGLSPAGMSCSSSIASVDTPDLVHWTDQILQAATSEAAKQSTSNDDSTSAPVDEFAKNADVEGLHPHKLQFDSKKGSVNSNLEGSEALVREGESSTSAPDERLDVVTRQLGSLEPDDRKHSAESYIPLSLQLPVEDLGTLEARFTRRRQQRYIQSMKASRNGSVRSGVSESLENAAANTVDRGMVSQQTSIKDLRLPAYYFTNPNLDDTASLLESLPWKYVLSSQETTSSRKSPQHVCHVPSTEDLVLWDESTTSRLCDLDSALDRIQSEILSKVQPHQPTLERANGLIHDFDQNLRLAFMYFERSKGALEKAAGHDTDGLAGPSLILETWQQREDYKLLNGALGELDDVWARERDLFQRIDSFDVAQGNALDEYYAVIDLAKSLEGVVTCGPLAELNCLDDTRQRLKSIGDRFWCRLLDILKSVVVRCCRQNSQFEWIEYQRLVRAVLDLHSQTGADSSLRSDFAKGWVEHLLAVVSFETDRSLAVALLQPTKQLPSTYDKELRLLAREIDDGWGDAAKIHGIVHNLVTIRFDLESHVDHLPEVMQRLFTLLTEILHAYHLFVKWHCVPFEATSTDVSVLHTVSLNALDMKPGDLKSILTMLTGSAAEVWEHCESAAAKCVDQYVQFAKRKPLFKRTEDGIDDKLWRDELDDLREVFAMASTFDALKSSFLEGTTGTYKGAPTAGALSERLSDLFRRHLRAVHVDAMNTIGRRLSNESWILGSFTLPVEPERTELPEAAVANTLRGALIEATRRCAKGNRIDTNRESETNRRGSRLHFAQFETEGNPFCSSRPFAVQPIGSKAIPQCISTPQTVVHMTLNNMIVENDGTMRLAPEAVTRELVLWFARLLSVMETLPTIAEDVCTVFANICDLYFTTVLRLCSGNEKNERILLGADDPSPFLVPRQETMESVAFDQKPQMFGSFRGNQQRTTKTMARPRTILPSFLEAEICSPIPRDVEKVESLRSFVDRAQKSLRDVVNLDMVDSWMVDPNSETSEEQAYGLTRLLTKRLGAIWSCFAVAGLIDAVVSVARHNLENSAIDDIPPVNESLAALKTYSEAVLDATPVLVALSSQMACTRAVAGSKIVKDIIDLGVVWEESKLHESSNEYVDELCYRNALIWGYLTSSIKFPELVLKETWENILAMSYRSLLDGFARVQYCSTEGRSLMALDLSAFSAGTTPSGVANRLENIVVVHKPPPVHPEVFNARHVEAFVKAYYFPIDDSLTWISENRLQYKLNHALSLVVAASFQEIRDTRSLIDLVEHVKRLYRTDSADSGAINNAG